MKRDRNHSRSRTVLVGTIVGMVAYMASLCFAGSVAEPVLPEFERPAPLASTIIPDEPMIVVYVAGEGLFTFRESEIRPQDR